MSSKRSWKHLLGISTASVVLAIAANASADISDTNSGGPAQVTGNFTMTLETGVTLTLAGSTDDGDSSTTTLTTDAADEGTVAFGNVNTITGTPDTGNQFRVPTGNTGAHFVATLLATVDVGGSDASLGLEREVAAGGAGDIPDGQLRFAAGDATDWTTSDTAGTAVPDLGGSSGSELGAALTSGQQTELQISSFLADDDAAGAYATAIVFTATAN